MKILLDSGHGIETPCKLSPDGRILQYGRIMPQPLERLVPPLKLSASLQDVWKSAFNTAVTHQSFSMAAAYWSFSLFSTDCRITLRSARSKSIHLLMFIVKV